MRFIGFETTFAPELEVLAPVAVQLSPVTSWHANSTPPRIASPLTIRPSSEQILAPTIGGAPDPRPTRTDKNRLSLTFLKRGNVVEQRGNAHKPNGALTHLDEDSTASNSNAGTGATRNRSKNRLSFLHGDDTSRNNSTVSSDHHEASTGKSDVAKSEKSTSTSQALVDRVGSVKKRLSILGLGKKAKDSGSVRTRLGGSSVAEE